MNTRLTLVVFALLLAAGVSTWLRYQEDILRAFNQTDDDQPDYQMDNFHYDSHDKDGFLQYTLQGVHLDHYPDDDRYVIKRVDFTAFSNQQLHWKASAQRAVVQDRGKKVLLQGDVVLHYSGEPGKPPVVIETADITFYPDRDHVESGSPTRIHNELGYIRSSGGFTLRGDRRELVMRGGIESEIRHD